MKHFISMDQLSKSDIIGLLQLARQYETTNHQIDTQVFAANLFFEPSTRTKMSFVVAERKLGIETLDFDAGASSMQKGETLYDTVKTFEAIGADVLVIRDQDDNWIENLNNSVEIPIINAGAGKKDHPTQSLLDAYTIYNEFESFEDLNIVIAGDIKHSRVAHSNIEMLQKLGANVYVSGKPEYIEANLNCPYVTIDEAVEICDVLMLLRIQHERHESFQGSTDTYLQEYGLTLEREKKMKENAIIMHPAPVNRGVEIDSTLVESERSRIFRQMQNGVYVRMAVLTTLLLNWGIINENQINKC